NFKKYQPDFYLTEADIYIEHYGIDREGNTAPWINKLEYNKGIIWKKKVHEDNKTRLLETFHYQLLENTLFDDLANKLYQQGVKFTPLPDESIFNTLRELGQIRIFSTLLGDLLTNMKSAGISKKEAINRAKLADDSNQAVAALELVLPILEIYEDRLKKERSIDFNDMINRSIEYVEQERFKSLWKYILVDEFQDISEPRAKLIRALKKSLKGTSIFCVGDDWQSIYRFTGSDINLTTSFEEFFGQTTKTCLDKTFRFNNSICNIASKFIMKNPSQINKKLTTLDKVEKPAVSMLLTEKSCGLEEIKRVLNQINEIDNRKSSVLILARFSFLMNYSVITCLAGNYENIEKITPMTIHQSKGKEADFVIIVGLENGKFGFPSGKVTHPLLELYLPKKEVYADSEERRLFYVALTRAKRRSYILASKTNISKFTKELLLSEYEIERNEFDEFKIEEIREKQCPSCNSGILVKRSGVNGRFLGCSNYPLCKYIESNCPKCNSEMVRNIRYRECKSCSWRIPSCPKCNGDLVYRKKGRFWGCSNYKGKDTPFSCTYSHKG
ncbi:MAG: UvrD-helicase domain-containing protein, partial [Pseudoalteromonas sp.]|uniref:UvrD-helicase domain-containing protein n=1 Tax=Pseudoalteromonas sp. TaxID=53249 RepID=UPI0025E93E8F